MHIGRAFGIGSLCAIAAWASTARATLPSAACKSGAEECRDAYLSFEKCLKGKDATEATCKGAKADTDKKCKETTSICHTDGSRRPPR